MDEFSYELKVPKDRIAVIIGKDGETKAELEEITKTIIEVDSKEGDVFITGSDAINLYTIREVIKAIGRGFNPDIAKLLLKQDYVYEQINITDYAGKGKSGLLRLKGRVIGKEGKARKLIEELTECYVCVYGKTISIIGQPEFVIVAKQAVESLLSGSPHSNVYRWLEKKRRWLKRKRMMEMLE